MTELGEPKHSDRIYAEIHGIRSDLRAYTQQSEHDIRTLMVNSERVDARSLRAIDEVATLQKRLYGPTGDSGEFHTVLSRIAQLEHEQWKRRGVGLLLSAVATALGVFAAVVSAYAALSKMGIEP